MRQLEIQYFFPLTEQMTLPLDFTSSKEYEDNKRKESLIGYGTVLIGNGGTWSVTTSSIESTFTIDIDQTPITIRSKEKPNFIRRYIYKVLGMKWMGK